MLSLVPGKQNVDGAPCGGAQAPYEPAALWLGDGKKAKENLAVSCFSCICRDRAPGVLLSGDDGQQWALESATSPSLFLDLDNEVGQPQDTCLGGEGLSCAGDDSQPKQTSVPSGGNGCG